jgi:hypothetical protein
MDARSARNPGTLGLTGKRRRDIIRKSSPRRASHFSPFQGATLCEAARSGARFLSAIRLESAPQPVDLLSCGDPVDKSIEREKGRPVSVGSTGRYNHPYPRSACPPASARLFGAVQPGSVNRWIGMVDEGLRIRRSCEGTV